MFNRWNRMSTRSCKASWWHRYLLSSANPTQSHWQFVLFVVSGSVGIIRVKWWWVSLGTPCVKLSFNWISNFSITYDIWLYCITVYPKLKSENWHLSLIQYVAPCFPCTYSYPGMFCDICNLRKEKLTYILRFRFHLE